MKYFNIIIIGVCSFTPAFANTLRLNFTNDFHQEPLESIKRVHNYITGKEYGLMPQLFHLDDFDRCMELGEEALYCTITVQLGPNNTQNESVAWKIIDEVRNDPRNYRHDLIRHAICVPTSCPNAVTDDKKLLKSGISECYTKKYQDLGLRSVVIKMHCQTQQPVYLIDNYDIAVGLLFGILFCLVIFASFYEGIARYKPKDEYDKICNTRVGRVVACFSIPKNWNSLRSRSSGPGAEELRGIHGMRFYNALMVVMAHTEIFTITGPVMNPTFVENLTRKSEYIIFTNGYNAIQTFMIITGFLVAYNFFKIIEKRKKFDLRFIMLAFLNRYIRLTPCLIVMAAFHSTWLYHLSRGPTWDKAIGTEYRNCRKNWWSNILYINNYYDKENMCMQNTWYLATDAQLFLLTLVAVAFMWRYQKRIKLVLAISMVIGVTAAAAVNYYMDFDIIIRQQPESLYYVYIHSPQWHWIYSSSITNFGGYAIGMVFGYIYYARGDRRIFTKKIYVAVWWTLVWGLPLGVIYYGLFFFQDGYEYTRIGAAIYSSLHKNLFGLGMGLLLYGTTEGIGWFVRDCLFWSPLRVFGRLTYCVYLVHLSIIRVRVGAARVPVYLTQYILFTQALSDIAMAYICAILLALFVELPASALQKMMVPQLSKQRELNDVSKNAIKDLNIVQINSTNE